MKKIFNVLIAVFAIYLLGATFFSCSDDSGDSSDSDVSTPNFTGTYVSYANKKDTAKYVSTSCKNNTTGEIEDFTEDDGYLWIYFYADKTFVMFAINTAGEIQEADEMGTYTGDPSRDGTITANDETITISRGQFSITNKEDDSDAGYDFIFKRQ